MSALQSSKQTQPFSLAYRWFNPLPKGVATTLTGLIVKFQGGTVNFVSGTVTTPDGTLFNSTVNGNGIVSLYDPSTPTVFGSAAVINTPWMVFDNHDINVAGGAKVNVPFFYQSGTLTLTAGVGPAWFANGTFGDLAYIEATVGLPQSSVFLFNILALNSAELKK